MEITSFYEPVTHTFTYIIYDTISHEAIIIDPVLNYDAAAGRVSTHSADELVDFLKKNQLNLHWILETHVHADHLTASYYLKQQLGGKTAISKHVKTVQGIFKSLFDLDNELTPDGSQFDLLLDDGDKLYAGNLSITVMATPGHTPADLTYLIDDYAFIGDTLFMPDVGTARCDFPGGNAHILWSSIQKLFSLPPKTKLMLCHDYPPATREPCWQITVEEQQQQNIHVKQGTAEEEFITRRTTRDKQLGAPALILPSLQVNIRAGELPLPHQNGIRYLNIPINQL